MRLTRCPACQTAFRVSPQQLDARKGLVRCGHCQTPFNARQHLIDEGNTTPGTPSDLAGSIPTQTASSARPGSERSTATVSVASVPAPWATHPAAPVIDAPDFAPPPSATTGKATFGFSNAPVEEELPPPASIDFWLPPEPPEPPPPAAPQTSVPPEPTGDKADVQPSAPRSSAARPAVGDQDRPYEGPHFEPLSRRPEEAQRKRTAWGIGIGALAVTLASQSIIVFRQELGMAWPAVRPGLLQLCATLGCDLPLPRIISKIALESSDLHPAPNRANVYILEAQILNRAAHVQAFPHLELTLTDARDRPLLRKTFSPAEWLKGKPEELGLAGGESVETRLALEARDTPAVGYRLYAFYP